MHCSVVRWSFAAETRLAGESERGRGQRRQQRTRGEGEEGTRAAVVPLQPTPKNVGGEGEERAGEISPSRHEAGRDADPARRGLGASSNPRPKSAPKAPLGRLGGRDGEPGVSSGCACDVKGVSRRATVPCNG